VMDDAVASAFDVLASQCSMLVGQFQEILRKLQGLRSASALAVQVVVSHARPLNKRMNECNLANIYNLRLHYSL